MHSLLRRNEYYAERGQQPFENDEQQLLAFGRRYEQIAAPFQWSSFCVFL